MKFILNTIFSVVAYMLYVVVNMFVSSVSLRVFGTFQRTGEYIQTNNTFGTLSLLLLAKGVLFLLCIIIIWILLYNRSSIILKQYNSSIIKRGFLNCYILYDKRVVFLAVIMNLVPLFLLVSNSIILYLNLFSTEIKSSGYYNIYYIYLLLFIDVIMFVSYLTGSFLFSRKEK